MYRMLAQDLYGQAGAGQPGAEGAGPQPGPEAEAQGGESKKDDDDVVDADFKEV
jgi:hypothetical protein